MLKNFDKYSRQKMRWKIKLFGTRKYSELGKQLYLHKIFNISVY